MRKLHVNFFSEGECVPDSLLCFLIFSSFAATLGFNSKGKFLHSASGMSISLLEGNFNKANSNFPVNSFRFLLDFKMLGWKFMTQSSIGNVFFDFASFASLQPNCSALLRKSSWRKNFCYHSKGARRAEWKESEIIDKTNSRNVNEQTFSSQPDESIFE